MSAVRHLARGGDTWCPEIEVSYEREVRCLLGKLLENLTLLFVFCNALLAGTCALLFTDSACPTSPLSTHPQQVAVEGEKLVYHPGWVAKVIQVSLVCCGIHVGKARCATW